MPTIFISIMQNLRNYNKLSMILRLSRLSFFFKKRNDRTCMTLGSTYSEFYRCKYQTLHIFVSYTRIH